MFNCTHSKRFSRNEFHTSYTPQDPSETPIPAEWTTSLLMGWCMSILVIWPKFASLVPLGRLQWGVPICVVRLSVRDSEIKTKFIILTKFVPARRRRKFLRFLKLPTVGKHDFRAFQEVKSRNSPTGSPLPPDHLNRWLLFEPAKCSKWIEGDCVPPHWLRSCANKNYRFV